MNLTPPTPPNPPLNPHPKIIPPVIPKLYNYVRENPMESATVVGGTAAGYTAFHAHQNHALEIRKDNRATNCSICESSELYENANREQLREHHSDAEINLMQCSRRYFADHKNEKQVISLHKQSGHLDPSKDYIFDGFYIKEVGSDYIEGLRSATVNGSSQTRSFGSITHSVCQQIIPTPFEPFLNSKIPKVSGDVLFFSALSFSFFSYLFIFIKAKTKIKENHLDLIDQLKLSKEENLSSDFLDYLISLQPLEASSNLPKYRLMKDFCLSEDLTDKILSLIFNA